MFDMHRKEDRVEFTPPHFFVKQKNGEGFTLIELLVVIAIIGVLTAIVLAALDKSREKGRDANRASQIQEFLKAAELYYTDNGTYPNDGTSGNTDPVEISAATGFLRTEGGYLSRIPSDPRFDAANGYLYCSPNSRDSMTILVHAESSAGDYCLVSRGSSPIGSYCGTLPANSGNCTDRF